MGAASYHLATGTGSYTDTYTGASAADWCMGSVAWKAATSTSGSAVSHTHRDHLGSTAATTDTAGSVLSTITYHPYGDEMATTGVQTLDRRYIGERTDDEELQYLNARYYNNGQGQFLSQDPVFWEIALSIEGIRSLRSPQVMNSYSYAANNPILYKDPTGRQYVDYNGGYTTPWGIGVTGGVQDSTSGADSVFYVGVTISRPGPSGSVTYSPDGNPSEGWGVSGNITYGPVTGQLSRDENGNWDAAGGVGIPGGGVSVTHGFTRRRAANFLFGSPVNNETTVMTTGAQPVSSGGGKFYIPLNTSSGSTKSNNAKNKTNSKSSGYAEVSSYIAAGMAAARRGDTASAKKYADEAQKKLNKN